MKILLDENLPVRLIRALRALGHDVEHANTSNLAGRPDSEVLAVAQSEDRFLITQDRRFADARVFTDGAHAGVLFLRLKSPGRSAMYDRVWTLFMENDVESWRGCFVVASDRKLRVRCPEP
jgi:predicted nuclease of predicted toxin-antitoxin system